MEADARQRASNSKSNGKASEAAPYGRSSLLDKPCCWLEGSPGTAIAAAEAMSDRGRPCFGLWGVYLPFRFKAHKLGWFDIGTSGKRWYKTKHTNCDSSVLARLETDVTNFAVWQILLYDITVRRD